MRHFIPYFIQEQFTQNKHKGRFQACTMFIDLSGFTALTESLMQQGNVGAEQLSNSLNAIFSPMVKVVYERGGFIPYYAGDAFTAIFPIEDAVVSFPSFFETAERVRDLFTKEGLQKTLFGDFQIGIKIGLSYGTVNWGIVGNEQLSYYFRGAAIDNCAACQVRAQDQEIIFDTALEKEITNLAIKYTATAKKSFFSFQSIASRKTPLPKANKIPEIDTATVRRFLPQAVIDVNQVGEFRSVISIFISFTNVDTYELLHAFSTVVLDQINSFSGYFKEIDFGDKGGVLVAFFGAPVSFENNAERALEFVLALDDETTELREQTDLSYRIGITSGTAYTGLVGGKERAQYAVVGNQVNLAARLMTYADWGEVLVEEEIQKDKHFRFIHKGDVRYKGIKKNVPTYRLKGRNTEETLFFAGQMLGRDEELARLQTFVEPVLLQQTTGLVYLYGEAGMGKSRLAYELKKRLELNSDNLQWITCQADQILQKPFNPFIYFLKIYFQQSSENLVTQNHTIFEQRFEQLLVRLLAKEDTDEIIYKELIRTKTVLAALVGLTYENGLWEQLDGKGRYQNTLSSISNLLVAEAFLHPIIIELEDGHWFDDNSKVLVEELVRKQQQIPFTLIVTSRYLDDGSKPILLTKQFLEKSNIAILDIDLDTLSVDFLQAFAEGHLGGKISAEFLQLLQRTTNGNPFYAEQILEYFVESNLLEKQQKHWHIKDKNIKLSNSINAILMARIDRLSLLVKETVKAAAVIGREFEVPVLSEVMHLQSVFLEKNGNTAAVLREQIKTAEREQIWRAMNELRYIFKHSLLREAVYDMQLRARLRELHQLIGEAIEKLYVKNIPLHYFDLAFHYEQAENAEKTKYYLEKAADYARANFQHKQALRFYDKLLALAELSSYKRIKFLLKKGSILELIGNWESCADTYLQALDLAKTEKDALLEARSYDNLGKLSLLQGNYEQALTYLKKAVPIFEQEKDELGISKVYGNLGNLYFRQGEYENAKTYFENSLEISKNLPYNTTNAQIVSNLGLTHMNQGNYQEGIECQERQSKICEQMDDKQAMATLYTNTGIVYFEKGEHAAALTCYQKGLALSEELGNKLLTSIAIGCIGSVYERQGDYQKAMEHFEEDLVLCNELGDKQGIAIVHGLLGDLYSLKGEFEKARVHLQEQLQLCEELNYQKGRAKALNTLGDVYTFKANFDKAIHYYDRAIELTRKIDNKLVLGYSLVEKSDVLIELQQLEEVNVLLQEAEQLAKPLGNSELWFETQRLAASLLIAQEKKEAATVLLKKLQAQEHPAEQEAAILYLLSQIDRKYQEPALVLYETLYQETPKYSFQQHIQKLKNNE